MFIFLYNSKKNMKDKINSLPLSLKMLQYKVYTVLHLTVLLLS